MPELPEVEVLVRHLDPLLTGRTVHSVNVFRPKIIRPDSARAFSSKLRGARFTRVERRAKYLVFSLRSSPTNRQSTLLGHLGMTGRMFLQPSAEPLPRHAVVAMDLGRDRFVFADTRMFGRLTTDTASLDALGPEPLSDNFDLEHFWQRLRQSSQSIKVKLLDQTLVVGIGNIYASEALHRARISPRIMARRLSRHQVERLWNCIREVLSEAIDIGSTIPLNFGGSGSQNGLFYYGSASTGSYEERLLVYGREGQPCNTCGASIQRVTQAGRSTFFCPKCQITGRNQ